MLNVKLELAYIQAQDEIYISAASLHNYLQVLEIEQRGQGNGLVADVAETLNTAFMKAVTEFKEEIPRD